MIETILATDTVKGTVGFYRPDGKYYATIESKNSATRACCDSFEDAVKWVYEKMSKIS